MSGTTSVAYGMQEVSMIRLGEKQELIIVKKVEFGVYLAASEETAQDKVLLPAKQVPEGAKIGDKIEVVIDKKLYIINL